MKRKGAGKEIFQGEGDRRMNKENGKEWKGWREEMREKWRNE